jgi:hypothetical protein
MNFPTNHMLRAFGPSSCRTTSIEPTVAMQQSFGVAVNPGASDKARNGDGA